MGHGLTKGDLIALTASGNAAEKLHDFLSGLRADAEAALAGDALFHTSQPIGAEGAEALADASDLPTAVALANSLKARINVHLASTGLEGSHRAASAEVIAAADATDLASAITLANEIKADYNTHLAEAGVHITNDGTNDVTAVNAADQATLETLLNEIKADYNAHIALATVMATPPISDQPT